MNGQRRVVQPRQPGYQMQPRGAYRGTDLFWYCLDHVPAREAWRCMPALVSGELPPEVPPPPSEGPPARKSSPNIWKWVAIGAIVYLVLKR